MNQEQYNQISKQRNTHRSGRREAPVARQPQGRGAGAAAPPTESDQTAAALHLEKGGPICINVDQHPRRHAPGRVERPPLAACKCAATVATANIVERFRGVLQLGQQLMRTVAAQHQPTFITNTIPPASSVFQAEVAEGSTCQLAPLRAGPATSHLRQMWLR